MDDARPTRWQELTGGRSGADYAARFARAGRVGRRRARRGVVLRGPRADPGPGSSTPGCGTGRVAIRLAALGFDVVGVDVDESMLDVAREQAPDATWLRGDLAALPDDLLDDRSFDLVVLAGNVVPLLAPGTLPDAVRRLARTLAPGGLLVAGFGLDAAHLPRGCPVTPLEEYDAVVTVAGLEVDRPLLDVGRGPVRPGRGLCGHGAPRVVGTRDKRPYRPVAPHPHRRMPTSVRRAQVVGHAPGARELSANEGLCAGCRHHRLVEREVGRP